MKKAHDHNGQKKLKDTEFEDRLSYDPKNHDQQKSNDIEGFAEFQKNLDELDDFYTQVEYTYEYKYVYDHKYTYEYKYSYEHSTGRKIQLFCKECDSML